MATATDTTTAAQPKHGDGHAFVQGVHGVRYQIQLEDPDGNPIELFEPARQLSARSL